MAANPSSYDPEACVFNKEETYWVQRQLGWLYSLLSQGADQRWNKVWQVKMNSQCQNYEIKLLIFLFCLSVVSLLSIAVQWNSVVLTWRFSFILMHRSRDDCVSCLRFAGRWHFLCYDLHILKVDPYHVEQPLKQFWSCLNDWNLFSIAGQWLLKNVIYDLWKSASPEAFYSPLFAVVHYFFDRVYMKGSNVKWRHDVSWCSEMTFSDLAHYTSLKVRRSFYLLWQFIEIFRNGST